MAKYLKNSVDLLSWNKTLASVLDQDYNNNSIADLLRGVELLVSASSGMFTLFSATQPPMTVQHRLLANENPKFQIDYYNRSAFLLDPFYLKAFVDKASGVFILKDLIPQGFEKSEYYNVFYQQLGFSDEVNIIFQPEKDHSVCVSIVRHQNEVAFSKTDINRLEEVYPVLESIICKWLKTTTITPSPNLEWQLDNALANFGSSLLTPKECEILQLVLHGYSIKAIAEKLGNSIETIKYHRKSIYSKLDVCSQSELFYLFIASVKAMPESSTADPMIYMK